MRPTRVFIITFLLIMIFLSPTFAQDYTRWELPEGAKFRLGKGEIPTNLLNQFPPYIFSPDSTQLAVMSSIGIWLYDVKTGKELALYPMELDKVRWRLAFKPNSSILVCGDKNGEIHFWDVTTRKPINKYIGHAYSITCISFNSDGNVLASGSGDETVRLWDTNTGHYKTINVGDRPDTLLFSPDGETLATNGYKGIMLWNTNIGELRHIFENTENSFRFDFSPNGQILASNNGKDTLFWNVETGKIGMKFKGTSKRTFLAFLPDGKWFATVGKNNYTVQLWDVQTGKLKNTFTGAPVPVEIIVTDTNGSRKKVKEPSNRVNSFAFSPNGNILAVSYMNEEIVLWNVLTGQRETTLEGLRNVYHLLFSPDGRTLVSWNGDDILLSDINTEDIKKSGLKHIITEHYTEVKSIALSPDGQTLATGHERSPQVWDLATGKQKKPNIQMHYQREILSLVYSPDGKILAGYNPLSLSIIILWDTISGKQITAFKGGGKSSRNGGIAYHTGHLAFSPDGKTLANSSKDNIVRLWDVKSIISDSLIGRIRRGIFGNQLRDSKGHTDKIQVVAFSPNGRILASGSDDQTICLWNVRTRKLKTTLNYTDDFGSRAKLNSLEFSPDGKILASGNSDGVIDLWDAVTTEHKGTLISKNPLGNTFLTFSPDSQTLASGVASKITLWDMRTQRPKSTFTLKGSEGFVQSIKFSHDGRTLASGNADGTILIWEVEP
ncbi:MAG: hypothetical protein OXI43_00210 [Candidatus Poribacteria bacterium]|nr:hypothetical protein [Candidatus Poribacteria bacterium]